MMKLCLMWPCQAGPSAQLTGWQVEQGDEVRLLEPRLFVTCSCLSSGSRPSAHVVKNLGMSVPRAESFEKNR